MPVIHHRQRPLTHLHGPGPEHGAAGMPSATLPDQMSLTGAILGHMLTSRARPRRPDRVEPSGPAAYLWTEPNGASDDEPSPGHEAWQGSRSSTARRRRRRQRRSPSTHRSSPARRGPPVRSIPRSIRPDHALTGTGARSASRHVARCPAVTSAARAPARRGPAVRTGHLPRVRGLRRLRLHPDRRTPTATRPSAWRTPHPPVRPAHRAADQRARSVAGKSLDHREPEGIAIRDRLRRPLRLCLGLASAPRSPLGHIL